MLSEQQNSYVVTTSSFSHLMTCFVCVQMSSVYCKIHLAVLHGHRKLAGKLVEEAEKLGGFGFNFLHKEVKLWAGKGKHGITRQ